MNVQVGEMIEISKEKTEKLGEVLVLKVSETKTGTPFTKVKYHYDGTQMELISTQIRISKKTARLLAAKLLKFAGST